MKHYLKPTCRHGCRFVQVSDELWLCPHAAYGRGSYLKGAVEEARALLERSGGYEAALNRVIQAEEVRREEARQRRQARQQRQTDSLRYR
jgi:hypothetical protein